MDKRTFLKLSSIFITGSFIKPPFRYMQDPEIGSNWAGNYHYKAKALHKPGDIGEVQELVKSSRKVRILGTRHSFNDIADSPDDLISLANIEQEMSLDRENQTITVSAGMKYGDIAKFLHENGYALHNLASLPHISVAGACATATHGSGMKSGNLSTAVSGLEILTASGDLVTLTRDGDPEQFSGAVVGLGGLGVVTRVQLNIQPTFEVRQDVYRNLSMHHLRDHFQEIMSMGYSVSFFTDYRNMNINQVWIKNRMDEGDSFDPESGLFDAEPAARHMHPIEDISAENCTPQLGMPGPWHERLPHFRMDFTPSSGDELQAEYFVPLEHAYEAIEAMFRMSDQISPHLLISEIRTIAEDNLWMSTAYQQPTVAIHFTWKPDWESVRNVLPVIEEQLAPYNVRPHWGKLFTLSPRTLQSRYEKFRDFRQLLNEYDREGKFRNQFLDTYIFES
jgi:alditol oxidase